MILTLQAFTNAYIQVPNLSTQKLRESARGSGSKEQLIYLVFTAADRIDFLEQKIKQLRLPADPQETPVINHGLGE